MGSEIASDSRTRARTPNALIRTGLGADAIATALIENLHSLYSLEGNMCGTATRGADALPGSKATSRAKGSHRKLGGLASGRQSCVRGTVRIGKVRSRSR